MHRSEISWGTRVTVAPAILAAVLPAGTGGAVVAPGSAARARGQSSIVALRAGDAKPREAQAHDPMPHVPGHFSCDDAPLGKA